MGRTGRSCARGREGERGRMKERKKATSHRITRRKLDDQPIRFVSCPPSLSYRLRRCPNQSGIRPDACMHTTASRKRNVPFFANVGAPTVRHAFDPRSLRFINACIGSAQRAQWGQRSSASHEGQLGHLYAYSRKIWQGIKFGFGFPRL